MKALSHISPLLVLGVVLAAGVTTAQIPGSPEIDPEDANFIRATALSHAAKVRLDTLAQERAYRPHLQALARQLTEVDSTLNEDLRTLAGKRGLALPANLEGEDQEMVDSLSKLSGADFDRAYLAAMTRDHVEEIAAYESALNRTKDPGLKAYIAKSLPVRKAALARMKAIANLGLPRE